MANCADSFRIFMGIADATAFEDFSGTETSLLLSSGEGDRPSPMGVDIFSENMKSSMFIASECSVCMFWSDVCLN